MAKLEVLKSLSARLRRYKPKFALIGGFAVGVYAVPRFTKNIDFVVAVDSDRETEMILHTFIEDGFLIDPLMVHQSTGRKTTARIFLPASRSVSPDLDLLFSFCGIEKEIVEATKDREIVPGVVLPVCSLSHLIALKVLSERESRPNDRADLIALLSKCSAADIADVKTTSELIQEREYGQGENLNAKFSRIYKLISKI